VHSIVKKLRGLGLWPAAKEEIVWNQSISAKMTAQFISLTVMSGRGMMMADPESEAMVLSSDVEDRALGEALLTGLSRSRPVPSEIFHDWYRSSSSRYEAWVASMLARFKYKSRRAMFKTMKCCSITLKPAGFELSPQKHEKLEGWGRTVGDGIEDVHLPRDATPAELGSALRLAFDRCR